VLHALNTVGGGLAALGIAVTMHVIGNQKLLPFFFLGYFLVVTSNQFVMAINSVSSAASLSVTMPSITTVTWAAFGVIIAFLYTLFTAKKEEDEDDED
jgi:PTS system mannose-specific IIC component